MGIDRQDILAPHHRARLSRETPGTCKLIDLLETKHYTMKGTKTKDMVDGLLQEHVRELKSNGLSFGDILSTAMFYGLSIELVR